jgi:hypothetical protein
VIYALKYLSSGSLAFQQMADKAKMGKSNNYAKAASQHSAIGVLRADLFKGHCLA